MKYSKIHLAKEAFKQKGFFQKLPDMFRMFNLWRKGIYKTNSLDMILPLLGVAYIISPIDLLPGMVFPVVGALDDLAVLYLILPKLIKEVDKFLLWQSQQKSSQSKIIEIEAVK